MARGCTGSFIQGATCQPAAVHETLTTWFFSLWTFLFVNVVYDPARTITQQMVVDNEVLAVLVYHIERVTDASRQVPAMELIGFQKYPWRGQPPTSAMASFQQHLSSPLGSPPVSPHSPTFSQAMSSSPVSSQAAYVPRSVPGSSPVDDLASRMLPYSFPTQQAYGFQPR